MKHAFFLVAILLCCSLPAGAQRRDVGNAGRGSALSEPGHAERPARTEQRDNDTPPPSPPPQRPHPIALPPVNCGGVFVEGPSVVVVAQATEEIPPEIEEPNQAVLRDCNGFPDMAGFDFSAGEVVACGDEGVDLYFRVSDDEAEFVVPDDTDIQDVGERAERRCDFPPRVGWASERRVPVVVDHCYILWSWDNKRYAFWVTALGEDRVAIEWKELEGGARVAADLAYRNGKEHRLQGSLFGR